VLLSGSILPAYISRKKFGLGGSGSDQSDGQSFQMAFLSWLTRNPSPSTKDAFSRNDLFIENRVRFPDAAERIVILKALGSATLIFDSRRGRVCDSGVGDCDAEGCMSVCDIAGSVCDIAGSVNVGAVGDVAEGSGGTDSVAMPRIGRTMTRAFTSQSRQKNPCDDLTPVDDGRNLRCS